MMIKFLAVDRDVLVSIVKFGAHAVVQSTVRFNQISEIRREKGQT